MSVSAIIERKLNEIEKKKKELETLERELEVLKKDTLRAQQMLESGKAPRKRAAPTSSTANRGKQPTLKKKATEERLLASGDNAEIKHHGGAPIRGTK